MASPAWRSTSLRSSRNRYQDPPSPMGELFTIIATKTAAVVPFSNLAASAGRVHTSTPHRWRLRRVFRTVNVLAFVWMWLLYWGERTVFSRTVERCDWSFWEDWPADAQPHRLLLVADPQLVDPHTYPSRPWPLSSLTMSFTDHYLSRLWRLATLGLAPSTAFFLGDLFDGGREWATRVSKSPEERYWGFGTRYWLSEYKRFGDIFYTGWEAYLKQANGLVDGRHKLIASLPGNHDIGFAAGIQMPVQWRFYAYFGDGNRIDVIGNHTFVSVDTVSLSAMETDAPDDVWKPTAEFLDDNHRARKRAIQRALKLAHGEPAFAKYEHKIYEADELARAELPSLDPAVAELPMILLSHVPLYRYPGTPCGPLRERWPPSAVPRGAEPLEKDDRNAISVMRGYQYQNVLSHPVTSKITTSLGIVKYAFSGDDHDYCDIVHDDTTGAGGIREVTVKSVSMAMGVRKPGFLQVSLWNPVDDLGHPIPARGEGEGKAATPTLQTNLCLMPDELGIVMRYAAMLAVTIALLVARAVYIALNPSSSSLTYLNGQPLLPTVREDAKAEMEHEGEKSGYDGGGGGSGSGAGLSKRLPSSNSSSRLASTSASLSMRPQRTRCASPALNAAAAAAAGPPPIDVKTANAAGYTLPLVAHAGYFGQQHEHEHDQGCRAHAAPKAGRARRRRRLKGWRLGAVELGWSVVRLGAVVLVWYWWLMRNG